MKTNRAWGKWTLALLDLLYPRSCLESGLAVPTDSRLQYLHPSLHSRLRPVRSPHCPVCGHPYFGETTSDRSCPHCQDLKPFFSRGKTAFLMRGIPRKYILALKYRGARHLIPDIVELLLRHPEYTGHLRGGVLVPVPLHRSRERKRGFNQARIIAEALATQLPETKVAHLLVRTRSTPTQTRLSRRERESNVRGAFDLTNSMPWNGSAPRLILFDDVFTTGATLNACAKVLWKAGARHIDVATIAHG